MAQPRSEFEPFLGQLTPDAAALARSVRARALQVAGLTDRLELRGTEPARAELLFFCAGRELGRLLLKAGALPRLTLSNEGEGDELSGLADAARGAARLCALAEEQRKRAPQLALF